MLRKQQTHTQHKRYTIVTSIICILLLSQVFGCGAMHRGTRVPVKQFTSEERAHVEKMKKELPKIHAALLEAAAPLSKKKQCYFPLEIDSKDKTPNAYCDGKKIIITETMLMNFSNSNEAAITLSHEIAHGLMGHVRAKQNNMMLGTVVDLALGLASGFTTAGLFGKLGSNAYAQDFELEADYVGMYLMARAGYDVNNAAKFWRKMALLAPHRIRNSCSSSHPGTAARYVLLEKTAQEIKEKKRMKLALIPEYKKKG